MSNRGEKVLFLALGYAIDHYFSNHLDLLSRRNQLNVLKIDKHPIYRYLFSRRSLLLLPVELLLFIWLILRYNPQYIVTAGPKIGFLMSIASFIFQRYHIHWYTGQVWAGNKRSLSYYSDWVISRLSKGLYCDGKSQAYFLSSELNIPRERIIVPDGGSINGIPPKFFLSKKRGDALKKIVVLYVGRITEEKGVWTILDIARLAKKHSNNLMIFKICGPVDPYFSDIDGFIEKAKSIPNVFMDLNHINPLDAFKTSDVLILPSYREGFGSIVIEAQAAGLPVVVSDIYGLQDALIEGKTGFFCDTNNPKSFYEKLLVMQNDSNKFIELSSNARGFAENFSHEYFLVNLQKAYAKSRINL